MTRGCVEGEEFSYSQVSDYEVNRALTGSQGDLAMVIPDGGCVFDGQQSLCGRLGLSALLLAGVTGAGGGGGGGPRDGGGYVFHWLLPFRLEGLDLHGDVGDNAGRLCWWLCLTLGYLVWRGLLYDCDVIPRLHAPIGYKVQT